MDIMAVFAALLEIARRSLCRIEIVFFCSFHNIAGTLNVRFSKIHGVLSLLRLEEARRLPEETLKLFGIGCDIGGIAGHQIHP